LQLIILPAVAGVSVPALAVAVADRAFASVGVTAFLLDLAYFRAKPFFGDNIGVKGRVSKQFSGSRPAIVAERYTFGDDTAIAKLHDEASAIAQAGCRLAVADTHAKQHAQAKQPGPQQPDQQRSWSGS
jgi:L-2-hydroxyglutarate oxidase LhgO